MIGTTLGHFEITAKLGEGGMGEVWRARDTKLGREVAIKALPEHLVADPERLARFEREARVLASLQHPNIAGIHQVEEDEEGRELLVMELVEGQDLTDRLARGSIPIDEALDIALQTAQGLEVAHERGIVHRDLKPANIKITSDGQVKILDFGLAKVREALVTESGDMSRSPTLTAPRTEAGAILGTPAYMSPEQATGKPADQRADLWSLGVLLFEMLTGSRPFQGETLPDLLASVLGGEIDWDRLPAGTPPGLRRLLHRCLERDLRRRLHAAADARIELEDLVEGGRSAAEGGPLHPAPTKGRAVVLVGAALLALLLGFALGKGVHESKPAAARSFRAFVPPPEGGAFELHPDVAGSVAVSPDGSRLVYSARSDSGITRLWIRDLDESRSRPLEGTEGGAFPFWSPDGRFVAFSSDARLMKIEASGGPPTFLADLEPSRSLLGAGGGNSAGTWNEEGVILFTRGGSPNMIQRIPADGGSPSPVTELDTAGGERRHRHPRFLPDGERFLYVASLSASAEGLAPRHRVMLGSLDGDEPRELMETDSYAEAAAGHLWFVRDGTLMAQRFDPDTVELVGPARPVGRGAVSSVWAEWYALGYFSVSGGGVLAYHTGAPLSRSVLTWYDREGGMLGEVGPVDYQYQLSLSSNGSQAVLQVPDLERGLWSLFVTDLRRGSRSRVTQRTAATGVWSPNDRRMAYQSGEIYVTTLGFEGAELLERAKLEPEGTEQWELMWPLSWSRDDEYLVYASTLGGFDLWGVSLEGENAEPFPIQHTEAIEEDAALSPDGRWLAYTSDRSGRFEVYLTAFPEAGRSWQVSPEGGIRPEWGPNGELFFLRLDDTIMRTTVTTEEESPSIGEIRPLFRPDIRHHLLFEPGGYAVAPDGDRILVNRVLSKGTVEPIALIVGWPEELDL